MAKLDFSSESPTQNLLWVNCASNPHSQQRTGMVCGMLPDTQTPATRLQTTPFQVGELLTRRDKAGGWENNKEQRPGPLLGSPSARFPFRATLCFNDWATSQSCLWGLIVTVWLRIAMGSTTSSYVVAFILTAENFTAKHKNDPNFVSELSSYLQSYQSTAEPVIGSDLRAQD